MKRSVVYAVISAASLILFTVCAALLPAQVSVHYAGAVADRFASPWVLLSFPAAAALLAPPVFAAELKTDGMRRAAILLLLFTAGATLSVLGWVFLALAAQGAAYGEAVYLLPWLIATLTLASAGMLSGYLLSEIKGTRLSVCGIYVFAASLAGFAVSTGIAFGAPASDWVGFLFFALMLMAALPCAWVRK